MRLILIFACVLTLRGATVVRMACGGAGGTDPAGNVWAADTKVGGGAAWTVANQPALAGQPVPYQALCYSSGTASFSRTFTVPAGNYAVTLKWLEPNATAAGKRTFSASINGAPVAIGLDVFAAAGGVLRPYDRTFQVAAPGGFIQVTLAGTLGNALLSGVQIDEAAPQPSSGGVTCLTGRVISTQLPVGAATAEITIVPVVSGDFRFEHVMVSEFAKFDGTPAPTVSMGRPGTNNSELTGGLFPLGNSNGDVSYWYAQPIPPQIFGVYPIVLNFQTGAGSFSQASGILKWEVCGYNIASGGATLTGLATCSGSGGSIWTDDKGQAHSSAYSCDGMLQASLILTNGAVVNLVGADVPPAVGDNIKWSPIPVK